MKPFQYNLKCVLLLSTFFFATGLCLAQDANTEIAGYYQQYRNFSFNTGISDLDIPATKLTGGGFSLTQNFAPWFGLWTQFNFYGSVEQPNLRIRVINNQQGPRWQTRQYGPFRFYVKGGLGFSHYSMDTPFGSLGDTKLSLSYGGGVQIWFSKSIGANLDLSQVFMGVPNLTNLEGRDKWDSGLTFSPGLAIRF